MEAKSASELPTGNHWQYEPKWDGFRCIAFRDDEKIELQSKAGRSLTRYFPDIVHALKTLEAGASRILCKRSSVVFVGC
jgi:ATP-dependent DNA ligase